MTFYFSLTIAILALVYASYLLLKGLKSQPLMVYLSMILLAVSIRIIFQTLFNVLFLQPFFKSFGFIGCLQFLIGPSVFLYLRSITGNAELPRSRILLHFLPAVLVFIDLSLGFILDSSKEFAFVDFDDFQNHIPGILPRPVVFASFAILTLLYTIKCFQVFTNAIAQGRLVGQQGKLVLNWCLFFFLPLVVIFSFYLLNFIQAIPSNNFQMHSSNSLLLKVVFIGIMIVFIGTSEGLQSVKPLMKSNQEDDGFDEIPDAALAKENPENDLGWIASTKSDNLKVAHTLYKDQANIDQLIERINEFVLNNKPFRNPNYGLEDLSNDLKIPQHHLRYLFKYHNTSGFVDFRNYNRTLDMLDEIKEKGFQNQTLESYSSNFGFGSHSAMLRSFKKFHGGTPHDIIYKNILS